MLLVVLVQEEQFPGGSSESKLPDGKDPVLQWTALPCHALSRAGQRMRPEDEGQVWGERVLL